MVHFADNSTSGDIVVDWSWDFGYGATSNVPNPLYVFPAPGIYAVTLTITTQQGCVSDTTHMVEAIDPLVVDFSDSSFCDYDVYFTDLSYSNIPECEIESWNWYFGDGGSSNLQHPAHTYAAPGDYNVQLTVTSSCGCIESVVSVVTILAAPVSDFSFASTGDYTIQFTDNSTLSPGQTINNWYWDFGDGTTSTLQNPEHVYNEAGIYPVSLMIHCDCGSVDTARKDVEVPEAFGITRNEIQQDFLYINPNPFNDKVEINFTLLQPSDVQLEIANMAGAVVKEMPVKHLAAGSRQIVWDADGAEPGIYFLRMSVNKTIYTRKIIKSR